MVASPSFSVPAVGSHRWVKRACKVHSQGMPLFFLLLIVLPDLPGYCPVAPAILVLFVLAISLLAGIQVLQRDWRGPRAYCRDSRYGSGSIPINTIFSGMNIRKSQLFWCSPGVQGFDTLPYDDLHIFVAGYGSHFHSLEQPNRLVVGPKVEACARTPPIKPPISHWWLNIIYIMKA